MVEEHDSRYGRPARRMQRQLRFSDVDLEVLLRVALGSEYASIASDLHFSASAVRYHADRLRQLLGAPNNVALVGIAVSLGLLDASRWPPMLTGLSEIDPDAICA